LVVAHALPVGAQRADAGRAATRTAVDSIEGQLRRLHRAADSLSRLFDDEDLSASERRRVGTELDRTIGRFEELSVSAAQSPGQSNGPLFRIPVGPIVRAGDMANALSQTIAREATPRGWIGIVVTGAATEFRVERGEMIVRYLSYPRVASVDPSSPAQRAGIAPNDTLLAYDGRDVRNADISMTRLLRPNNKVVVRVRRDGRVRELPVVVAAAPLHIKQRRDDELRDAQTTWAIAGAPDAPAFPRMSPPQQALLGAAAPRTYRPAPGAPLPPAMAVPPMPPAFTFVVNGVAGAQLVTVTEGLARTLGLQSGVLIANAPPGSPAAESGLRDGDVIVKVSGQPVRNVAEVRELVARASEDGERSVDLETVREKKTRKVALRW
jgi:membrane-associated protease RseP (regulator of RpoE activity)